MVILRPRADVFIPAPFAEDDCEMLKGPKYYKEPFSKSGKYQTALLALVVTPSLKWGLKSC